MGATQLLLSGDGRIAFTSNGNQTRVWDIAARRELAPLANRVLAVASDGQRALCVGRNQDANYYDFWRLTGDNWQRGTSVIQPSENLPLVDAIFRGNETTVMWLGRIEIFAPDGTKRTSRPFDEGDRLALDSQKTAPPVGALSPDGKRLILWNRGWARVCDSITGKRLTSIYEPEELQGFNRIYRFSPDNKFVVMSLNSFGDGGYLGEEGVPILTGLAIYNAKNGKSLRILEDVGSFNFPFSPTENHSLIFQVRAMEPNWNYKLEKRNVGTNAILSLTSSNLNLSEHWIIALTFARDGKSYVALDRDGDIWAEQVGPN